MTDRMVSVKFDEPTRTHFFVSLRNYNGHIHNNLLPPRNFGYFNANKKSRWILYLAWKLDVSN